MTIAKPLLLVFFLLLDVGATAVAEDRFPGPLTVHVTTTGSDAKPASLGGVYVFINARQAATNAAGLAILDGVPAGRHRLGIHHPGFEAVDRDIDLALGTRAPIEVPLVHVTPLAWHGNVRVQGLDQPIVGAEVRIRPVAVKASLQGPGMATADWEGNFEFVNLPPGSYALAVSAPGFDGVSQEVRVKAPTDGAREFADPKVDGIALDVCRLPGAECGKPAADAFCRAQGMGEALEHRVRDKAPPTRSIGNQQKCDAAGCGRIEWLKCADAEATPVVRLNPISTPAGVQVAVTDSVSRQPMVRARVTLAETWPNGGVANGETDARGLVNFDKLRAGAVNWTDGDNRVALARHRLTVRVEADGYEPTVVPAALNGKVTVELNPLSVQPEAEPDDMSAPQDVRTGAPIRFSIDRNSDHDAFRFRLPYPARLVARIGPNNPIETYLRIFDSQAKQLAESGAYANNDNRIELWLAAGTYFAEVQEWGNNNSAPDKPMTLTLAAEPAVDPSEPNDTLAQATPIQPMEQVSGLIWPVGDRDYYRIEVKRPGLLRVREPGMPIERYVRILKPDGSQIAEQGAYANNAIDLSVQTAPGSYLIEVREWGDNNASLTPYRLCVDTLPDDGIDDPDISGPMRAVRELALGSTAYSTLMPTGDHDLYRIPIPGAGRLHLHSEGRLERYLQLYDRHGRQFAEQGVYANNPSDITWDLGGPDTVYLNVREWGDNTNSPTAYSLSAWFEPADEVDFLQRNEDFDHATPLFPGDTARGSYLPMGDRDVYLVESDFPGYLRVKASSAHETYLRIFDGKRQLIAEQGVYANNTAELAPQVAAGPYYVMLGEWGDNAASPAPYEMTVALERAEPAETWPLASDPPRRLKDGEAQSFSIDHIGDVDRFLFEVGRAGKYTLAVSSPLEMYVRIFDDQTGALMHESGHYAPANPRIPLEFKNPVRLRIELREWGDNNASLQAGFIMIDSQGRALAADRIGAEPVSVRPLQFNIKRQAVAGTEWPSACELDLNRDGRSELRLEGDQARAYAFPDPGLYLVESICKGSAGETSRQKLWIQATAPRERKGVVLSLPAPVEGQVLDDPVDLRAVAMSYDGKAIARVTFEVDGKSFSTDFAAPFEASLPWQSLGSGEHALRVTAWDTAGSKATLTRKFSLSEYFGLSPADGAVLSGERIRVAWTSPGFGASKVRYRKKGSDAWQEAVGESGRAHVVGLDGLEPGAAYEFQPLGAQPGPQRTVTRFKGLAFSQPRYAADIRRDYDQRVGIGVRNNGDKPLKVRLECGKPKDASMLVGFVGEGSEDKPIDLAPGESRQFVLGLSAQDVRSAEHRFPVRIVADAGLSDEAEVAVHVQLPRVELAWSEVGPAPDGQGRIYRLTNNGDPVTDLDVTATNPDKVSINPTVRHGLLAAGQTRDFTVTPQFYDGFTGVGTKLVARGLDNRFEQAYAMHLAPGESARRVWLFPGLDPQDAATRTAEKALIANAQRAADLKPESVDWSGKPNPEDTDHDGKIDRWSQLIGNVRWVGDDTNGDGMVDVVHADVGDDGIFEYSAILENGKWQPTNLVEAWLEMGFTLPWNRTDYKAHDADIILNGTVIGALHDTIPEGNYAFRIPPKVLRFDDSGKPGNNEVGIRSKHLRGGHYVVNSDFRFKFRLTATPVWTVANSEEAARTSVAKLSEVTVSAPDFSISSADLRLTGPAAPKAGDDMVLEVPIRNLGASAATDVPVTVSRTLPNGGKEEMARVSVERLGLEGPTLVRIPFKARGGASSLLVSVDPDDEYKDLDRANNTGNAFMRATGDTKPPVLKLNQPADGQTLSESLVTLSASATDEQGLADIALSIDGGLWQDLKAQNGAAERMLLLQPGAHRLELRASDFSGNGTNKTVQVRVVSQPRVIAVIAPADNATVDARSVEVVIESSEDAAVAAARIAGGVWYAGKRDGSRTRIQLPLDFGAQRIEAMVADRNGTVATTEIRVNCTRQPAEGEARARPIADQGLVWPSAHSELMIDLFKGVNGVLVQSDARLADKARRLLEEALPTPPEPAVTKHQAIEQPPLPALPAITPVAAETAAPEKADVRFQGHRYRAVLVTGGINWADAGRAARALGGHLASIGSAAENDVAYALVKDDDRFWFIDTYGNGLGPWLGGFKPGGAGGPHGGWQWVTGEDFAFANWGPNQPDNAWGREHSLHFFATHALKSSTWNDIDGSVQVHGYVVEFDDSPPAVQTGTPKLIFEIGNVYGVDNKPFRPSVLILDQPQVITLIQDYHWNSAKGAAPGSIGLRDGDGKTYGPWSATGSPGQGGVANAYWTVRPNINLPAGRYTVLDSDPASWAQNKQSQGAGFVRIEGYEGVTANTPIEQATIRQEAKPEAKTNSDKSSLQKKVDDLKGKFKSLKGLFGN